MADVYDPPPDGREEKPITANGSGGATPVKVEEKGSLSTTDLFKDDSPPPESSLQAAQRSASRTPPAGMLQDAQKDEEDVKPKLERGESSRRRARRATTPPPTLIADLPTAWDAAHETFETLDRCVYETKKLGLSMEEDEMMVCDCVYDRDDPLAVPCGPHSDCINRAIFIECLADECKAGRHCHNQRFSKQQFAELDVVQTEKKGFGLRAKCFLPAGTLIYEYIGEVVAERTFRKRMQKYAEEGIKHFYFMMLQKEEYIDATKKGGIGRFANHSCNPNSEVQKWVVGRRLRMGIFTKRDVLKDEEITFNYNVDRYGHDAQICYCGELNCVGFIGGKTQTDVVTMNDLFLDALGIMDDVLELDLKGNKKKKSKQLDEDFIPILRPIKDVEVQKVAAAMRQSMQNRKMMSRLLERIKMTDDIAIHRQLMRMHGFSLMNKVLAENHEDDELVLAVLESMMKWKLQIRHKIEDSRIEEPVTQCAESGNGTIREMAKQLLEYWSTLDRPYRIPRVSKIASQLDAEDDAAITTIAEADSVSYNRRPDAWENTESIQLSIAPVRFRAPVPAFARPKPTPPPAPPARPIHTPSADRSKLDAIIAMAQQSVAAAQVVTASPTPSHAASTGSAGHETPIPDDEMRRKRQKRDHGEDEAKKEKRMTKLVGEVVVRSMTKYRDQMDHETFKTYAKECTHVLVEKEKKGSSYTQSRHPSVTEDKKAKIKAFTKEYTHKVLKKLKEKGKLRKTSVNGHSNGHSHSRSESSKSASQTRADSTPAETPMSESTPSLVPDGTPTATGSSLDLVSDIFGADEDDDLPITSDDRMGIDTSPIAPPSPMYEKGPLAIKLGLVDQYRPPAPVRTVRIGEMRTPDTPRSGDSV